MPFLSSQPAEAMTVDSNAPKGKVLLTGKY